MLALDGIETQDLLYGSMAPDGHEWWNRIDPMYEVTWKDMVGDGDRWESIAIRQHAVDVDGRGFLHHFTDRFYSPIQVRQSELHNYRTITIMSLLMEWHQLTTLQLMTFLGEPHSRVSRSLGFLYSAGILETLKPYWMRSSSRGRDGSGQVWRIAKKSPATEQFFNSLGNREWFMVLNGSDPAEISGENTPTTLRHNLLTAEIALKAMEASPFIIGAWGEDKSRGSLFIPDRQSSSGVRNNVGDGALITRDGRIIVLEVTTATARARTSSSIVDKAAAWATIAARSDLPLDVLFIDASSTPRPAKFTRLVRYGYQEVSKRYMTRARDRERGGSRLYTADARRWFPLERAVTPQFTRLNCWSLGEEGFRDLLEPTPMDTSSDVVVNTATSLATPRWVGRRYQNG